jgi:hypothetical protein
MRKWINLFESIQYPEGTPLFFVPIRYWEVQEPETGHALGEKNDGKHVYVYHDGYGHNVYMDATRTFDTREEAITEAFRLKDLKQKEEDDEFDQMMARVHGTAKVEPKAPREPTFVPDVGTIVEYGLDSFGKKPATYRVDSWLKEAPVPPPSDEFSSMMSHILYSSAQKHGADQKRLMWCTREEAEYLSLSGIAGAIARVDAVKVIGRVSWSEEMIDEQRRQALAFVGEIAY